MNRILMKKNIKTKMNMMIQTYKKEIILNTIYTIYIYIFIKI